MEPNINTQMEEDQDEDDLWHSDDDEEDWDDYNEQQKEAEYEERAERAAMCKCGAWVITERGNVYHVADCCCGAE